MRDTGLSISERNHSMSLGTAWPPMTVAMGMRRRILPIHRSYAIRSVGDASCA